MAIMDIPSSDNDLKKKLSARARAAGFDTIGFTSADLAPEIAVHFKNFLSLNRHGDMAWMERKFLKVLRLTPTPCVWRATICAII